MSLAILRKALSCRDFNLLAFSMFLKRWVTSLIANIDSTMIRGLNMVLRVVRDLTVMSIAQPMS